MSIASTGENAHDNAKTQSRVQNCGKHKAKIFSLEYFFYSKIVSFVSDVQY